MKVLVACEFSGRVRDAFIRRGHEAVSCDLLPSESPGPHYQGDVRKILRDGWDLMVAHPPCYRLTTRGRYRATEAEKREGEEFFMAMVNAPISRIAIENPKGAMSRIYRTPDQIIQPWMFGDKINKATCLWLKDCPPPIPHKGRRAGKSCSHRFNDGEAAVLTGLSAVQRGSPAHSLHHFSRHRRRDGRTMGMA